MEAVEAAKREAKEAAKEAAKAEAMAEARAALQAEAQEARKAEEQELKANAEAEAAEAKAQAAKVAKLPDNTTTVQPEVKHPKPVAKDRVEATPTDYLATHDENKKLAVKKENTVADITADELDEAVRSSEAQLDVKADDVRTAEVISALEAMRGAIAAYKEALVAGHPEVDVSFHSQHNALTTLLRTYPRGTGKEALDEMVAAEMSLAPGQVKFDPRSQQAESVLYGLQKVEEAKFLSKKALSALEAAVGAGDVKAASVLHMQRNTLDSLDAAEKMKDLEMQKEALELEAKESQLLQQSSHGVQEG
jgi:hypothetical protein